MTRNEFRFIELAKYFLFGFNPRKDDEVMCLDCILSCSEDVIRKGTVTSIFARDFAYAFIHYYYENPQGEQLHSETKDFIDNWKRGD